MHLLHKNVWVSYLRTSIDIQSIVHFECNADPFQNPTLSLETAFHSRFIISAWKSLIAKADFRREI